MPISEQFALLESALRGLEGVTLQRGAPLWGLTRFGVGGPAALLVECYGEDSFLEALRLSRQSGLPVEILGGGTNVVASDAGFPGIIIRYRASEITNLGTAVSVPAGTILQSLVDFTIDAGLGGIETLTGIPGWVGGAIYGNAGAYGHAISERIRQVRCFDGAEVRTLDQAACRFRYRESVFKENKGWIVLAAELALDRAGAGELRRAAMEIRGIRDKKYPPDMRCAGSIFKNLIVSELPPEITARVPESAIREGKVASAWFLERVGAKGIRRGDIQVASYHANLLHNDGHGTAADLRAIVEELKERVFESYGLLLEEEVQYIGFPVT